MYNVLLAGFLFHSQPADSTTNELISMQLSMWTLGSTAWRLGVGQDAFIWARDRLSLCLSKAGGALMSRIRRIEAVNNWVNHDRLLGYCEGTICWHGDPVV